MALLRDTGAEIAPDTRALAAPLVAGAASGFVAGVAMLAVLMTIGALVDDPTAKSGVSSSLVTMPNSVAQFTFSTGIDQFGGDYRWLTYPGIALHLAVATALGAAGAAIIATLLGRRPGTVPAVVAGIAYGAVLQVVVLFGFVGGLQDVDTVETAVPVWGWWAAHGLYGALVGAIGAPLMRAAARRADAMATVA